MSKIKRVGNLINEKTITLEFCKNVIYETAFRKTMRKNVVKVLKNIDYYADKIRNIVLNDTYKSSPYGFEIRYENGKERKLQKPKFLRSA